MVKKKDGAFRPVIDYRELNAHTEKMDWPIERIEDIIHKLRGAKYFTVIDAKSGFFQIPIEEESKQYTAFSDGSSKYEWNVMPMGLTNAPIIFSMVMYEILGQYEFVIVYFDDICIYSNTVEEHIEHLKLVFEKFVEVNLKINPEKSQWIATKIKLLGYVISSDGIEMDPEKVSAIKNRKPPSNIKQLQETGFKSIHLYQEVCVIVILNSSGAS